MTEVNATKSKSAEDAYQPYVEYYRPVRSDQTSSTVHFRFQIIVTIRVQRARPFKVEYVLTLGDNFCRRYI
jgi:hypothetical protein